jgi:hypothetical protein
MPDLPLRNIDGARVHSMHHSAMPEDYQIQQHDVLKRRNMVLVDFAPSGKHSQIGTGRMCPERSQCFLLESVCDVLEFQGRLLWGSKRVDEGLSVLQSCKGSMKLNK